MKVLGIETATPSGGVAIIDESTGLVVSVQVYSSETHSVRLMPTVERALKLSGLALKDIDAIGVSIGPGSFTGIRIGMSVAKGLAFAGDRPLIAVPTLEALAYRYFRAGKLICPMIDARRQEVYAAIFEVSSDGRRLQQVGKDMVILPRNLLQQICQPAIFSGTGALRYRELIVTTLGDRAEFAPPHRILPSAEEVAYLALERFKENKIADPTTLEPRYIRPSDAELTLEVRPQNH
ncbi:tRNA (adenosine(37)-N6)-threonylcarbamoyltransferase complex dimerization subunit type 1 TsaB [Candidatus Sumerlaeota bacterium]|nr:tRNA (adenosine(37)-N6)-threonylcarbamoyltransferase complex dimerization subunit type 1 TsaB [Candidatus Sumerlaeota bacterium]